MKHIISILVMISIIFTASVLPGQEEPGKELKYEVMVNARLIPVFAVDGRGNPVQGSRNNTSRPVGQAARWEKWVCRCR